MRMGFARLDDALIDDFVQPASDFITHRLGIGRTVTACFCIDVASSAWIVSRAHGLSDSVLTWDAGRACFGLVLLLLGLAAMVSLRLLFRRSSSGPTNPLRLAMRPHRAVVLLMLAARLTQLQPLGLAEAADLTMLLCATLALYLGACGKPPIRRLVPGPNPDPQAA